MSLNRYALIAVPAIAAAIVVTGLRAGAAGESVAALVYAAPPGAARRGLAVQVHVVREAHIVRDAVVAAPLTVTARRSDGRTAEWRGATNEDGVAEAWLDLPQVAPGEALELRVTRDSDPPGSAAVAQGNVHVPERATTVTQPVSQFSRREGKIALDVVVAGGRLAVGFPSTVWVHAVDAASGAAVPVWSVTAEPEGGLELTPPTVTSCAPGWAELTAVARTHSVGTGLTARTPQGLEGVWYGGLIAALGAASVTLTPDGGLDLLDPSPRKLDYVEIDDRHGRVFAAFVSVTRGADGFGHAHVPPPPAGVVPANTDAWVVVAGDARHAETMEGSARALPLRAMRPEADCLFRAEQAAAQPQGFPRSLVIDGFRAAGIRAATKRRRGQSLAMGGVVLAAMLELVLILRERARARAEGKRFLDAVEGASDPAAAQASLAGTGWSVFVLLGLAVMGFALLAGLATSWPLSR